LPDELERIDKETVIGCLKKLSGIYLNGLEETMKPSVRRADLQVEI
jgi:hypothetical protein